MRATFRDMTTAEIAAWIPEDLERARDNNRGNHYLSAVARLGTGVSVTQAQAEVDTVMARIAQQFPESSADKLMRVVPLHGDVVGGSARAVSVLMGAAGLVLLIACVNVAGLFLVRALGRGRNTAIRLALGAGRRRVVVQYLTESLVVAAAGGLLGSIVAHWGVRMLLTVSPESLARAETVGFDIPLLLFAVVLTTLAGTIFGLAPAWRAARVDPGDALHDGARGNTNGRGTRRVHALLVMTQVAVALMLLTGAGVLVRSLLALQAVDLGFQAQQVATFEVHLPPIHYGEPAQRVRFHQTYLDRLRAAPGIVAAGATSWLPANGAYHRWGYGYLDESAERQWTGAMVRTIEGEYFDALGIPLLRGRQFTSDDGPDTESVAMISQSLAAEVYGDGEPLGERFRTGGREFAVVGIVGDVAFEAEGDEFGTVYVSHGQFGDDRHWALTYVVKTAASPAAALTTARQVLHAVDDALVLHQPRAMSALVSGRQAQTRFTVFLLVLFAVIAVTLAGVGVYGVLAYAVSQRTHELGVRMALGAQPGQVRSIVVWQGVWLAGVGLVTGLAGALALSRFLSVLTFEVSARDPLVFIAVTALLATVVLGASYLPARRATRIDPLVALRSE